MRNEMGQDTIGVLVDGLPNWRDTVISKDEFIKEVIRIARERGYKIESNTRTGQEQIDFGNKKLHSGHLGDLYPAILSDYPNISSQIDKVAPGRGCSHKPMREIIEQLRIAGKL